MIAALPENEEARLAAVAAFRALDADSAGEYDDFTKIASCIAQVPIALITLIDRETQIFKSRVGISEEQNSRDVSFCAHAILNPHSTLTVEDATQDIRFADNPLVKDDLRIRFYCGVPLVTEDNFALGTLCVIDKFPRILTKDQEEALQALARRVINRLEIHKTFHDLERAMKYQSKTTEIQPTSEVDTLTRKLERLFMKREAPIKRSFK